MAMTNAFKMVFRADGDGSPASCSGVRALGIAVLCLALAGCSFLDESPRDQKTREEVVTSEATLYLNTLGNLYRLIGGNETSQGLAGTYRGVYDLNTFTTDEAILPTRGGDWYDGGLWQRLYLHTWEVGDGPIKDTWNYLYKVVVLSNQAIADLEDRPEWRQEARAVRALYYCYLLDMYGRVPIVTSPTLALSEVEQSSRAEVFQFVASELEEVAPDLPLERSNALGSYYGRVTRPVAWFLMEKLWLNAPVYAGVEDYQRVMDLCDSLTLAGYRLEDDYAYNFSVHNEDSEENIFTIPMDKHLYSAQNQYLFRSRHYDHAAAIGFTGENGSSATLEVLEAAGFGGDSQDPRFDVNYWGGVPTDLDGNPIAIEYKPWSVALDLTGSEDEKLAGARMRKYEIDPHAMKDGKLMDNDWVLFRYADALLMKAEALLRTGEEPAALEIVNQVRLRAGAAALESIDLDTLLEERMRELAWEGLRRQDLVRFGRFGGAWSFREPLDGEESGYTDVFPIPADVLTLNPLLTQNDGY